MPLRHAVTVLCLTIACGSCRQGEPADGTASSSDLPTSRSFAAVAETLWIAGGSANESLFTDPWHIAAAPGGVLVADIVQGLLVFDGSGEPRWSNANPPAGGVLGPIVALDDSTVVVVRSDNAELRYFEADGRERRPSRSTDTRDVRAVCALDPRTLLLGGGTDRLATVSGRGGVTTPFRFPWPSLRDSASLLRQTVLASTPSREGCVIALAVGEGFAITRGGDSTTVHPYIERIELPPVAHTVETAGDRVTTTTRFLRRATAAASIAADDSSIYIAFGGATPRRRGLVDIYDRETGAYRASLELGAPILALAAGAGALHVQYLDSGVPTLAALRIRWQSEPVDRTPQGR
jgi:hypothetical protein